MDSISLFFLFFTVKLLTNAILCVYVHRIFVLKKCNFTYSQYFFLHCVMCYVLEESTSAPQNMQRSEDVSWKLVFRGVFSPHPEYVSQGLEASTLTWQKVPLVTGLILGPLLSVYKVIWSTLFWYISKIYRGKPKRKNKMVNILGQILPD